MFCPLCTNPETRVLDSRMNGTTVRRRRECPGCSGRFTTYEKAEIQRMVLKKNHSREQFEEEKIKTSIQKALTKDNYEHIESIAKKVIRRLINKKKDTIKSWEIGRIVLQELKKVDKLAYLRYATVHKSIVDPKSLEKEIQAII